MAKRRARSKPEAEATAKTPIAGKDNGTGWPKSRRIAVLKRIAQNLRIAKKGAAPMTPSSSMTENGLTAEEVEEFHALLLEFRKQILGNVDHMQDEALRKTRSDASGDLSLMPIHMADIGTDNYEREFTIGLIENETKTLKEIDAALVRLEKGAYGICEATHKPIGKERLMAKPWARFTVEYKRSMEANKGRRP
ncbi:MAG: TraR/DksA C4-type zinc finger protein [Planctomycetota bacterium]